MVITQFAMSLDGYICEEDTESCRPWRQMATDDEPEEYLITRLPRAGTHIMGPATYQDMAAHWPAPPSRSRRS